MTRFSAPRVLASARQVTSQGYVASTIYSTFSYYGAQRAYQLPGRWFVAALGDLGYKEMRVRQTLFRMVRNGELTTRVQGRNKFYCPTPPATPEVHAGTDRIRQVDWSAWDGQWTIVQMTAAVGNGFRRQRLHELLYDNGFAWLSPGVFIHPRDRIPPIIAGAKSYDVADALEFFRARRVAHDHREFAARHWDLEGLRKDYERFLRDYEPLKSTARRLPDRVAFVLRFAVASEFLKIAWRDPELPPSLLPGRWPGVRAQALITALDRALSPAATAHADALMAATRSI